MTLHKIFHTKDDVDGYILQENCKKTTQRFKEYTNKNRERLVAAANNNKSKRKWQKKKDQKTEFSKLETKKET